MTVLGFIVVHIVVGNLIEPKLMGKGLSLSTLVVFLSLVFWGWVLGPIGMILSVPMTSLVKIALESYEETQGIAFMLGSDDEIERNPFLFPAMSTALVPPKANAFDITVFTVTPLRPIFGT